MSNEQCKDCYWAFENCKDITLCCDMEEYDGDKCEWFRLKADEDEVTE